MKNLQQISSNQQSKYDEIIEYLKQDNRYWLENDKWDLYSNFNYDLGVASDKKYLDFSMFNNENIRLEVKYYYLYSLKQGLVKPITVIGKAQAVVRKLSYYTNKKIYKSIIELQNDNLKLFLLNEKLTQKTVVVYLGQINEIINFTINFYDDREETEKDIWYPKNIKGVKTSAVTLHKGSTVKLDFTVIPKYYRKTVKRYLRSFITKKSWSHCRNILDTLNIFFNTFYEMGYIDGFLKNLTRDDIEKYLYAISNKYKDKNVTYANKFIAYPRTFLEYIQMAQYKEAPIKEVSFLIFENDIPKRERDLDRLQRVSFIPEPILKQLDNNIMELDRPQFIPIYIFYFVKQDGVGLIY